MPHADVCAVQRMCEWAPCEECKAGIGTRPLHLHRHRHAGKLVSECLQLAVVLLCWQVCGLQDRAGGWNGVTVLREALAAWWQQAVARPATSCAALAACSHQLHALAEQIPDARPYDLQPATASNKLNHFLRSCRCELYFVAPVPPAGANMPDMAEGSRCGCGPFPRWSVPKHKRTESGTTSRSTTARVLANSAS